MPVPADKRIILITGTMSHDFPGGQKLTVTGATNGIGLDTTIFLAAASPANHIIMGARSLTKAETKLSEVHAQKPKGSLSYVQLDVNDDESISAAVKKIKEDFGRIDVLVHNAGVCPESMTQQFTPRQMMRDTFETNVYGVMVLTEAAFPLLKASKNPMVINVRRGWVASQHLTQAWTLPTLCFPTRTSVGRPIA
tara:strand:+ start:3758 stop:4342 length:585 start_codon:yes stop_codon:yes gene_type:complete